MLSLFSAGLLVLAVSAEDDHGHSPDCTHSAGQGSVGTPATTGPSTWAGIPLAGLAALGLGEPDLDLHRSGWRATLPEGGFVRMLYYPDLKAAQLAFSMQKLSSSTRVVSDFTWRATPDRDVQAAGDTSGFLVLRDGNVVFVVRDHRERAGAVAEQLQAALVGTAPEAEPVTRDLGDRVVQWDSCGRLVD